MTLYLGTWKMNGPRKGFRSDILCIYDKKKMIKNELVRRSDPNIPSGTFVCRA